MDFIFNQNVGDGANVFMVIVALIVGLAAGLSYIDNKKTQKEQDKYKLK
ncbi:MAG: hypothetical protein JSS79_07990 [Bacteroidetes bacterium]|nr:hypothetical protein [Bacteroidota bacterium]